jgi:hypothetical protein
MPLAAQAFSAPREIMASAARELLNFISPVRPGREYGARRVPVPSAVTPMPPLALEPFGRHVAGGRSAGTRVAVHAGAPSIALVTSGCARRRGHLGPARASKHGAK